jgi:uroporphyrinogen-III synthase
MACVLITRAQPEASALAHVLESCGHSAVLAPLAELQAVPVAWPHTLPDALIFTSGNAALHISDDRLRQLPVFSIGPHTHAAARNAGFEKRMPHMRGDYTHLLQAIGDAPYTSFWHIGGRDVRHDITADLARRGKHCCSFVVYEMISTKALPYPAHAALAARALDLALIFSPRSAERALHLLGAARLWLPAWVMSPAIAAPLQAGGWQHIHISSAPDKRTLLAEAGLMCEKAATMLKGPFDER